MKKILTLFLMLILVTGCSYNKHIKYDLKNTNNYQVRIRIKDNLKITNNILISKYNDSEIKYKDDNITYYQFGDNNYITNDKTQVYNGTSNYDNYNIVFKSLSKLKKVERKDKDLVGDKTIEFIKFSIGKNELNDIMKSLNIDSISKTDGEGIVYFDSDGYLYKIIYKNDDIDIEVTITKYNGVNKIYRENVTEVKK